MEVVVNSTLVLVPALNGTLIDIHTCTIDKCSLTYAQVDYIPSFAGNTAYLAIFGAFLVVQVALGIRYRTAGFTMGMFFGLVLEIIGYIGRKEMHNKPFDFNNFVIYLVCLTIGPAFISASIYLCLSRLVVVYSQGVTARFSPKFYTLVFVLCDLLSLILQATGGALAATQSATDTSDTGANIMIAGLSSQVVSLVLFIILGSDFVFSVSRNAKGNNDDGFAAHGCGGLWRTYLKSRTTFRIFPYALALATIAILIRCAFRVAELQGGFGSKLANDQTMFMIFEGPMIMLAVLALTVCHPGIAFGGKENWKAANWTFKNPQVPAVSMESSRHASSVDKKAEEQV